MDEKKTCISWQVVKMHFFWLGLEQPSRVPQHFFFNQKWWNLKVIDIGSKQFHGYVVGI